jgi:D-3-phosphoglycerate dehydrogenase
MVAAEAGEIITGFLLDNEIRYAINMAPVSGAEMEDLRHYLGLSYRLGLLASQMIRGQALKSANIDFRGDAADKNTRLLKSVFTTGLLEGALDASVNLVNAASVAKERGINITESASGDCENFASLINVRLTTDQKEFSASGTIFGNQFQRLVRLGRYPLEAFLDGTLLIYRHRDVPGLIGFIGSILGRHHVNIANMALGRQNNEAGGDSVAVLNLDTPPSQEALDEILEHDEVTGIEIVRLPDAGINPTWMGA